MKFLDRFYAPSCSISLADQFSRKGEVCLTRQVSGRSAAGLISGVLIVLLSILFLIPEFASGQTQLSNHATNAKSAGTQNQAEPNSAANNGNSEILQELEQMRARIQELEAKLKQQSNTPPSNTASNPDTSRFASESAKPGDGQEQATASPKPEKAEPFAFADFTWLNGNPRTKTPAFDSKFFTPEIRADVDYIYDFRHPKDDTISGSSEVFRSSEVQLTQLGVGGDFHYDNVRARLMTQFGMYSQTTPRNDASPSRGQWNLDNAYRYISEAYGGYHFNALHGINVDAGIFMSYVGLFSYYNFDNWAYQPSYVSSNTPWFFNGVRVQIFPTEHLKIEPWFTNGWQAYGRFNHRPGVGGQILWRPNGWLSILGNQYALGADALGIPGRIRYHTDDSIQVKYYDDPDRWLDGQRQIWPKQSFLGFMAYNRFWFHKDLFGMTIGGGKINNPGRYLVLLPPINGATAASGTPYFTENPGDPYKAWDMSGTFDWMPSQYITFRWEYNHRADDAPYFSGPGGVTPAGGNMGAPGSLVPGWAPDLRKSENRLNMAILVKF
jgi:hypothetical protein